MLTDLPDRFAAYRERHPRIVFSFRETFSRALIEAVQAGSVDIAFVREREPGPDLAEHVVFREPFVAITRETGPQRESVSLRRLAEEPFILFPPERAPLLHDQVMHVCREQGFMPRVTHLADGWTAALALVRSGFGVTVGPASLRRMSWPGLSFHDLPGSSVRSTISMLWKESGLSPAGQGLVRLFSEDA